MPSSKPIPPKRWRTKFLHNAHYCRGRRRRCFLPAGIFTHFQLAAASTKQNENVWMSKCRQRKSRPSSFQRAALFAFLILPTNSTGYRHKFRHGTASDAQFSNILFARCETIVHDGTFFVCRNPMVDGISGSNYSQQKSHSEKTMHIKHCWRSIIPF